MNRIAYFNNAATTFPKPEEVYDFVDKFYRESGMNSDRGYFDSANKMVKDTRSLLLELFHCPNKKVVFTPTATEAMNVILQGLPIADNINIYVSPFEHNAVIRVLKHLQDLYRINIITLSVNEQNLAYDLERISYQFAESRPNIVVISHASNVCGAVAPIKDICTMSHQYQAVNVIDMCQTAGLIDTDLRSDIYDFAVFAGHKTLYATFGIAGFVCSGKTKLKPLLYGGTGIDSANLDLPDTFPERYEVGSMNVMAIAGLNSSLNWIRKCGIDNIKAKENENLANLMTILNDYKKLRVIKAADPANQIGVVSCLFDGYSSDDIGKIMKEHGIEVRTGLHCAPNAHKFLGTFPAGTVRFSVGYFNTEEDFLRLRNFLLLLES